MTSWLALIGRSAMDTVTTVTLPVVVLLWLLAWLEASGRFEPTKLLARAGWRQPVYSAAIAAIPGCAGGIAVTRLYVDGVVGYAALWAAHLATSGDASFVLLVGRPLDAIAIFAFLFILGAVVGVFAARIKPATVGDMLPPVAGGQGDCGVAAAPGIHGRGSGAIPQTYAIWVALVAVSVLAAIVASRAGAALTLVAELLAALAILLSIHIQRGGGGHQHGGQGKKAQRATERTPASAAVLAAVKDASEITLWVAVADLAFYTVQHLWGLEVRTWLNGAVLPVTLIAIAVGMIPGCGPQIFLARLYTAGSLPFAPILANSISQHGDAIFPLLSRRRRDALRVSLASLLVAAAVGLIWFGVGRSL